MKPKLKDRLNETLRYSFSGGTIGFFAGQADRLVLSSQQYINLDEINIGYSTLAAISTGLFLGAIFGNEVHRKKRKKDYTSI